MSTVRVDISAAAFNRMAELGDKRGESVVQVIERFAAACQPDGSNWAPPSMPVAVKRLEAER